MKLFPHQAALVEAFFDPASKRILLLRSDAGLGVTAALAVVVQHLLHEQPQARVLFLAPSPLRFQIIDRLRELDAPSQLVDRYRFREMFESTTRDEPWPYGTALVLSLAFAKQPDIRASLAKARWDLVIASEAHRLRGARAEALRRIITSAERAILATTTLPDLELSDAFPSENMTEVVWQRDKVVGHDGKSLDAAKRPVLYEVAFCLSPAELGLRARMADICRVIGGSKEIREFIAKGLFGQMDSSPVALEGALQRLVQRLEIRDSIDEELGLFYEEEEDQIPEYQRTPWMNRATNQKVTALATKALQEIETITADSKLRAFGQLLDRLDTGTPNYRRICILTDYLATLYYLAAEIEDRGMACQLVHGAMSAEDRHRALTHFANESKILIATMTVGVASAYLAEATDLVLYDLPGNRIALHELLSQFDRFGRKRQLTIHALTPLNEPDHLVSERLALLRETLDALSNGERTRR